MNILHWMKKENSGLARTTLELVKYEEKQGHKVLAKEPGIGGDGATIYMAGMKMQDADVHCIHSQLAINTYYDNKPKFMWMHGEPLSSVANGISMKAIVDLAPKVDAFICMRREEQPIWNAIKRTYYVPKGIDLEHYKKLEGITERLSGEPAVLYVENWRGNRNPLYLCSAMQQVWEKFPNARLHLYNCIDKKMHETFSALIKHTKWHLFIRSLLGQVSDINMLYNRVDIVVSCLYPLYARGIEAFSAGRAFIGPGYKEPGYPFTCNLDSPDSMAQAITSCWENYDKIDYRKWAEERHDVNETVRQSIEIYQKYL